MKNFGIYLEDGILIGFVETDKTRPPVSSIDALFYGKPVGGYKVHKGTLPCVRTGKTIWYYMDSYGNLIAKATESID